MPSFTVYKGNKDGAIYADTTTKPELTGDQVHVKVTASGLCGTDMHYKNADMALGHEGVGVVESLGPDCKVLKKGDRVGWGYVHDTCGFCKQCLSGKETTCPERKMYGMADFDQGSMASAAVWREAFLFQIPDDMSDEVAAPLMCGGATVYNALGAFGAQASDVVGVIGIGGLGHLALQYAAKMGCHVVALSGSDRKKDEAMKLGAHEFIATKDKEELTPSRKIDRLLVTTSAQPEWEKILPIMAPQGKITPLSVSDGNFSVPYMGLLVNELQILGSLVAARHIHKQMIEFSALHKIGPTVQKFPMTTEGITKAIETLESGDMRYRGVLIPQSESEGEKYVAASESTGNAAMEPSNEGAKNGGQTGEAGTFGKLASKIKEKLHT